MYTTYIETIKHNAHRVVKTYKHTEIIHKTTYIGYTARQALKEHKRELKNMGYKCSTKNTLYIHTT